MSARKDFGLWKSRCTERILILRDPRGFSKEAAYAVYA